VQRSREDAHHEVEEAPAAALPAEEEHKTRFATAGAIPPVAAGASAGNLTASERGYDGPDGPLSANGQVMERVMQQDHAVIEEASRRYGVAEVDILAIITQESRGNATANAGRSQKDHGAHAAAGLMQVTEETWKATTARHPELARYTYSAHRYDRRANILVGTASLAAKKDALEDLGVSTAHNFAALVTMAYNAGEGVVSAAYNHAVAAGSRHPDVDCLKAEHLMPAIAKYPSVYKYYLTGGGKSKNPKRSVQRAIELKYHEISKYPEGVELLIAEANEHELANVNDDSMPHIGEDRRSELA
jgi:hypothetical protein